MDNHRIDSMLFLYINSNDIFIHEATNLQRKLLCRFIVAAQFVSFLLNRTKKSMGRHPYVRFGSRLIIIVGIISRIVVVATGVPVHGYVVQNTYIYSARFLVQSLRKVFASDESQETSNPLGRNRERKKDLWAFNNPFFQNDRHPWMKSVPVSLILY